MNTTEPEANAVWWAALRHVRRLIVFVVGTTVLLLGVVMLVTPGPAFVFIPMGLGILAIEFVWARRLLSEVKRRIATAAGAAGAASADNAKRTDEAAPKDRSTEERCDQ